MPADSSFWSPVAGAPHQRGVGLKGRLSETPAPPLTPALGREAHPERAAGAGQQVPSRTASARCERADRIVFIKWCRVSGVSAWEGKRNLDPYFTSKTKLKWSAEFMDGSCKVS